MNISPIQQVGGMGMNQMAPTGNPQLAQPQQQAQQQGQQQPQEKLDNISKVKSLVGPLREALSLTLKTATQTLQQNSLVDVGSTKGIDPPDHRFNKNMEDFYSICDQIELHLKTSIECMSQHSSSIRYLPIPVMPTRTEAVTPQEGTALTYPQFLMTVQNQVQFSRDVHNTMMKVGNALANTDT